MTALPRIEYFLGANAPTGFYSLYDHLLPPEQARAIYILKGGPGCGKSTLMCRVGAWAEEAGLKTEYILCSGDPDSLDAVVLPERGAAIVDGTAPHVVEPKYPGAVERYVNMGDCYDKGALWSVRQEIMSCMSGYKGCYQRAYRCLGATADVMEDQRSTLLPELRRPPCPSEWTCRSRARPLKYKSLWHARGGGDGRTGSRSRWGSWPPGSIGYVAKQS